MATTEEDIEATITRKREYNEQLKKILQKYPALPDGLSKESLEQVRSLFYY